MGPEAKLRQQSNSWRKRSRPSLMTLLMPLNLISLLAYSYSSTGEARNQVLLNVQALSGAWQDACLAVPGDLERGAFQLG